MISGTFSQKHDADNRLKWVTGTRKTEPGSNHKIKASNNVKKWHLYVRNLNKGTTKENIAAFVEDVNIKLLSCELFDRNEFV